MKKLSVLRDWTKVLFVLCVLPLIFFPAGMIMYFWFPDMVPIKITFIEPRESNIVIKLLIVGTIVAGYCLFVYALYLFKKVLKLFSMKRIFDDEVIKCLGKIGRLIYFGLLLSAIPYNAYLIFTQNKHELDQGQLFDVVFIGTLGFFFTVLSEVFQKAKNIKEENDLTV